MGAIAANGCLVLCSKMSFPTIILYDVDVTRRIIFSMQKFVLHKKEKDRVEKVGVKFVLVHARRKL